MITTFLLFFGFFNPHPTESRLEQILAKHLENMNATQLSKIKSLEMQGKVQYYLSENAFRNQIPSLTGRFEEIIQRPDKRYYQSWFENVEGSFREGRANTASWSIDGGGLKSHQLTNQANLQSQAKFDITPNLHNIKERGFEDKYLGKKELDEINYHCIKLTHEHGIQFYYFELKTSLVKCIIYEHETLDEQQWTRVIFDDYRKMNGSLFPYSRFEKMFTGTSISTMHFQYTEIKVNNSIDPLIFEAPKIP